MYIFSKKKNYEAFEENENLGMININIYKNKFIIYI